MPPTQEPNHYWPFDKLPIKPASAPPPERAEKGQEVIPFQMSSGNSRGRDFAFEPTFFELDDEGVPKVQAPTLDSETITKSLGE